MAYVFTVPVSNLSLIAWTHSTHYTVENMNNGVTSIKNEITALSLHGKINVLLKQIKGLTSTSYKAGIYLQLFLLVLENHLTHPYHPLHTSILPLHSEKEKICSRFLYDTKRIKSMHFSVQENLPISYHWCGWNYRVKFCTQLHKSSKKKKKDLCHVLECGRQTQIPGQMEWWTDDGGVFPMYQLTQVTHTRMAAIVVKHWTQEMSSRFFEAEWESLFLSLSDHWQHLVGSYTRQFGFLHLNRFHFFQHIPKAPLCFCLWCKLHCKRNYLISLNNNAIFSLRPCNKWNNKTNINSFTNLNEQFVLCLNMVNIVYTVQKLSTNHVALIIIWIYPRSNKVTQIHLLFNINGFYTNATTLIAQWYHVCFKCKRSPVWSPSVTFEDLKYFTSKLHCLALGSTGLFSYPHGDGYH